MILKCLIVGIRSCRQHQRKSIPTSGWLRQRPTLRVRHSSWKAAQDPGRRSSAGFCRFARQVKMLFWWNKVMECFYTVLSPFEIRKRQLVFKTSGSLMTMPLRWWATLAVPCSKFHSSELWASGDTTPGVSSVEAAARSAPSNPWACPDNFLTTRCQIEQFWRWPPSRRSSCWLCDRRWRSCSLTVWSESLRRSRSCPGSASSFRRRTPTK